VNGICYNNKIDFLYPTHDVLLGELSFHSWRTYPIWFVSRGEALNITGYKKRFWRTIYDKYPLLVPAKTWDYPFFARPNIGRGSIGAQLVQSKEELAVLADKYGTDYILTEVLPGKEYTVDCINDLQGNLLAHCIRERIEIKRGITHIGRTVCRPDISEIARVVNECIPGIKGGWFFQVKEDEAGNPKLLEANLRVSGTMCLTRQAGLNIPLLTVMLFRGEKILQQSITKPKMDLVVSRRLTEQYQQDALSEAQLVIWDLDDTLVDGTVDHNTVEAIFPHKNIVDTMISLYRRGAKQAICSRNRWLPRHDRVLVEKILQLHCIPTQLLEIILIDQFREKSCMIQDICAAIEISPDRAVLIDDSFKERQAVELGFKGRLRTVEPSIVTGR
jgi:hypothetical protein